MLIENDAYLLQLSYYIHRNPLRARLVKRLASHRWSSYQVYAYGKSIATWLNTDLIMSQFVADKLNRDLLIYLLWQLGQLTNQQIGEKFGLSYSAVSQRVSNFKGLLIKTKRYVASLIRLNH